MTLVIARLRRLFHCAFHLHRGETAWVGWKTVYVGCECGKVYYNLPG